MKRIVTYIIILFLSMATFIGCICEKDITLNVRDSKTIEGVTYTITRFEKVDKFPNTLDGFIDEEGYFFVRVYLTIKNDSKENVTVYDSDWDLIDPDGASFDSIYYLFAENGLNYESLAPYDSEEFILNYKLPTKLKDSEFKLKFTNGFIIEKTVVWELKDE